MSQMISQGPILELQIANIWPGVPPNRQQIEQYNQEARILNIGTVFQVGDGIARVYGLEQVIAGELLEFEDGTIGIALNLDCCDRFWPWSFLRF